MARYWRYNPSVPERKVFEEYKEMILDYLIGCKEGVAPGAIGPALRDIDGCDIPFLKMGLPSPNIRHLLYAMRDYITCRMLDARVFVYINDAMIPENKKHVRQMVRGQASSKSSRGRAKKPSMYAGTYVSVERLISGDSSRYIQDTRRPPPPASNGYGRPDTTIRAVPFAPKPTSVARVTSYGSPSGSKTVLMSNGYERAKPVETKATYSAPVRPVFKTLTERYEDNLVDDEWDLSSSVQDKVIATKVYTVKAVVPVPVIKAVMPVKEPEEAKVRKPTAPIYVVGGRGRGRARPIPTASQPLTLSAILKNLDESKENIFAAGHGKGPVTNGLSNVKQDKTSDLANNVEQVEIMEGNVWAGARGNGKGKSMIRLLREKPEYNFPPFLRGGHQHPANQSLKAFYTYYPEYLDPDYRAPCPSR